MCTERNILLCSIYPLVLYIVHHCISCNMCAGNFHVFNFRHISNWLKFCKYFRSTEYLLYALACIFCHLLTHRMSACLSSIPCRHPSQWSVASDHAYLLHSSQQDPAGPGGGVKDGTERSLHVLWKQTGNTTVGEGI